MRQIRVMSAVIAVALVAIAAGAARDVQAQTGADQAKSQPTTTQPGAPPAGGMGRGAGMMSGMGGGQGPGMGGYGMGMMGPGMIGGYGYGPGMMGPRMMRRAWMGPGMMGGYGMGMTAPWMTGRGWMGPPMAGAVPSGATATAELTTDDIRKQLQRWLDWGGNPRLKIGDVKEKNADTITADIVTKDNSLVERLDVNRHTGVFTPAAE